MLNLMAFRYGNAGGEITLENFVVLVLRMDCMASESLAYYVVLDSQYRSQLLYAI